MTDIKLLLVIEGNAMALYADRARMEDHGATSLVHRSPLWRQQSPETRNTYRTMAMEMLPEVEAFLDVHRAQEAEAVRRRGGDGSCSLRDPGPGTKG